MPSAFYTKWGYDVEITVGSYYITTANEAFDYGLTDSLTISAAENTSRTAYFTFIPPTGPIDITAFQGQPVHILIHTSTGIHQVFHGVVDTPKLDFRGRRISLECSDQRSNRIIQLPLGVVSSIGNYSEAVFGKIKDRSEELDKRLQTVAASFDFDSYGNWHLTNWTPKAVADYTITPGMILRNSQPSVNFTARTKTINTYNIAVSYTYQRLHHQTAHFVWSGYQDFLQDWYTQGRPTFPTRDAISGAINNADWRLVSNPNTVFTPIWPAQGFNGPGGVIIWQPNEIKNQYAGRVQNMGYAKDGNGDFITVGTFPNAKLVPIILPVLDNNGKQIMDLVSTTITDTSSHLCKGASWTSALRFAQTVTEKYNITITAPQSVAKYGVVDAFEQVNITDPYDTSKWEGSKQIHFVSQPFYINQKTNYTNLITAMQAVIKKAKRDMLALHRDVEVSFRTVNMLLLPQIDLQHTVDVTIDESARDQSLSIHAKGKVYSISHNIDFRTLEAYTTITLRLSRSTGSVTESPLLINQVVEDPSYIGTTRNISLGTHVGINPDPAVTVGADKWTGWIGNKWINGSKTNYPEEFRVDYPAIPDNVRDQITYESDTTLLINIPNDPLDTVM